MLISENEKAALLLGLQWREIPVSSKDQYSLRGAALRQVVEKDVGDGSCAVLRRYVISTPQGRRQQR